jgi:hypothetical protein
LEKTGKAKGKKLNSSKKSQASNISVDKSMTSERSLLNKSVKSINSHKKVKKLKVNKKE